MGRSTTWAVIINTIFLLTAVQANADSPALEVSLGFGGYVVPNRWSPLWIRSNQVMDKARVEIRRLDANGQTVAEESFPYRAGSRIECPIMIDDSVELIQVRVVAGEDLVAEREVDTWGKAFPGHIILACGQASRSEQALGTILFPLEPVQVVSLAANELPGISLDYDSVGAVAMNDPGQSLSPSQREALRAWLSGGGTLALTDVKPNGHSLLDALGIPRSPGIDVTDGEASAFGLGRVFASRLDSADFVRDDGGVAWRVALALKPYESTQRLDYSRVFSRQEPVEGLPSGRPWSWWLVLPLTLWVGGAIGLAILKRGRYAPLLVYSAASFVLAAGGGFALDRAWQRGCRLTVRAIVLPETGGLLVDASASLNAPREDDLKSIFDVPRNVSFDFDRTETGTLRSAGPCEWRHGAWKTYFTVRTSDAGTFSLGSSLPATILEGTQTEKAIWSFDLDGERPILTKGQSEGLLSYLSGDDSQWWDYDTATGQWRQCEQIPAWLGTEEQWVLRAKSCLGRRGLLVGFDLVPELRLSMQGRSVPGLFWAAPLGPGRGI